MVNIEAIHGTSREGKGVVQFLPNDLSKAARALNAAGIAYTTREVLIVRVLDEPGQLGDIAARAEGRWWRSADRARLPGSA